MRILPTLSIAGMLFVTSCSHEAASRNAATDKDDSSLEQTIRARFSSDAQIQDAGLTITANAKKSGR